MSLKRKSAISVLAVAMLAAIVGMALTFSAFTATTENGSNTFTSGSVLLSDNATGSKLFEMAGMQPGSVNDKCIKVTYSGTLDSKVRLYATSTASTPGADLAQYLDVDVLRGSFPGDAPAGQDCTGFEMDATAPLLFQGTLAEYPADYEAGIQDANTFSTGNTAVYKIHVALKDTNDAMAKDATTKFTFEARDKGVVAP